MSDTNGWAGKPGVPLNPEQSNWHWVSLLGGEDNEQAIEWLGPDIGWDDTDWSTEDFGLHARYLGPAITPAEVEARVQQARRDALEEAARVAEDCDHPWVEAREAEHEAADLMAGRIAGAIRALSDTPPGMVPGQLAKQDLRSPDCIKQWPECESGAYDPRCCRFPKSCSCESGAQKGEGNE